jgi:hypothetical protein
MTNYDEVTLERWAQFSLDQQILMIGNEMNRARRLMTEADVERRQSCYQRTLQLVDLTLGLDPRPGLRRELGLWRGVIADLHMRKASEPETHRTALTLLLQMRPALAHHVQLLGL